MDNVEDRSTGQINAGGEVWRINSVSFHFHWLERFHNDRVTVSIVITKQETGEKCK